jgi:hypothetical protein
MTNNEISCANKYIEELRRFVHDLDLPNNDKVMAAGACFDIALEHHHAIVRLVELGLLAPAFSLVRAEFDACIRGNWLWKCANEAEIEKFINDDKEPPPIQNMITQVEDQFGFGDDTYLSQVKKKSWKPMCSYTHTGGLHVQRRITKDGIKANYSKEEVLEVIRFAEVFATLATIGFADLADNVELGNQILEAYVVRSGENIYA